MKRFMGAAVGMSMAVATMAGCGESEPPPVYERPAVVTGLGHIVNYTVTDLVWVQRTNEFSRPDEDSPNIRDIDRDEHVDCVEIPDPPDDSPIEVYDPFEDDYFSDDFSEDPFAFRSSANTRISGFDDPDCDFDSGCFSFSDSSCVEVDRYYTYDFEERVRRDVRECPAEVVWREGHNERADVNTNCRLATGPNERNRPDEQFLLRLVIEDVVAAEEPDAEIPSLARVQVNRDAWMEIGLRDEGTAFIQEGDVIRFEPILIDTPN